MTISYVTIFLINFMLKGIVELKSNSDTEELIKGELLDKIKDSLNLYILIISKIFLIGLQMKLSKEKLI